MKYELGFIGVDKKTTDADAVCFRYSEEAPETYVVGVYDGGTQEYGEALQVHLNNYYSLDTSSPAIDFAICSHPDEDHASGLSIILEHFNVDKLFMNRPWLYVDELYNKVDDGRITKDSLEKRLREAYPYINDLEKTAIKKGIEIYEAFEGTKISDEILVLSPSKQFYLD